MRHEDAADPEPLPKRVQPCPACAEKDAEIARLTTRRTDALHERDTYKTCHTCGGWHPESCADALRIQIEAADARATAAEAQVRLAHVVLNHRGAIADDSLVHRITTLVAVLEERATAAERGLVKLAEQAQREQQQHREALAAAEQERDQLISQLTGIAGDHETALNKFEIYKAAAEHREAEQGKRIAALIDGWNLSANPGVWTCGDELKAALASPSTPSDEPPSTPPYYFGCHGCGTQFTWTPRKLRRDGGLTTLLFCSQGCLDACRCSCASTPSPKEISVADGPKPATITEAGAAVAAETAPISPSTPSPAGEPTQAVQKALDALESGSSYEQRRDAWNALRDAFFPLEPSTPSPDPIDPTIGPELGLGHSGRFIPARKPGCLRPSTPSPAPQCYHVRLDAKGTDEGGWVCADCGAEDVNPATGESTPSPALSAEKEQP